MIKLKKGKAGPSSYANVPALDEINLKREYGDNTKLAKLLGVCRVTIWRALKGKGQPELLAAILEYYRTKPKKSKKK